MPSLCKDAVWQAEIAEHNVASLEGHCSNVVAANLYVQFNASFAMSLKRSDYFRRLLRIERLADSYEVAFNGPSIAAGAILDDNFAGYTILAQQEPEPSPACQRSQPAQAARKCRLLMIYVSSQWRGKYELLILIVINAETNVARNGNFAQEGFL